jgi:hypothetical protein
MNVDQRWTCEKCGAPWTHAVRTTEDGPIICSRCTGRTLAQVIGTSDEQAELAVRGVSLARELWDVFNPPTRRRRRP